MGSQSRHNQAMDAQTRQANALERIADALDKLVARFAPQPADPYEPSDEPPDDYVPEDYHGD
jgi:hypothetical protein